MNGIRLTEIAQWTGGEHIGHDVRIADISTDTRQLSPGDLFVAIKGDRFDGNAFALRAMTLGASAVLVNRRLAEDIPQIIVQDSVEALGRIAHAWRERCHAKVVAVTGSNGKTTVKEMIAAVLSQAGSVLKTQGNLNNHIGVPLTLLRMRDEPFAVIEMGASRSGEIAHLARVAQPDIGVVTNAGEAHLEGFGSRDAIAFAKGELFQELPEKGVAVINADDRYATPWRAMSQHCQSISFGFSAQADVRGIEEKNGKIHIVTPSGDFELNFLLKGRHNILNALAATAVGIALGMDVVQIASALETFEPVNGRLMLKHSQWGHLIIDDTYNANPGSFKVAVDVLKECEGERWLIAGDMAELGEETKALHHTLGEQAREAGIDRLYAYGEQSREAWLAFNGQGGHFEAQTKLITALREAMQAYRPESLSLLVKGSRKMRMELIVSALQNEEERVESLNTSGVEA